MDNTNNKKRTRSNSPTTTTEEEERYQKRLKLVPVLADTRTDKKNKKNKRRKNVYFLRSLFIHLSIDGDDGDEENNAEIFAADDEVYDKADEFDNVYFLEQLKRARENAEKSSSQLMKPSIFHANLKQGEFFSMVPPQPQVSDQDRNEWSERPYDYMNLLANTEYTFFFQLRKIPRMCSRLLQNTETGAFLVCDRMDMELKLQNKNNYPIRVMLAVYNPHPIIPSDEDESDEEDDNDNDNTEAEGEESGEEEEYLLEGEVKSIYPKESLTISSVETDFVRVPPGKTEMITILASQFGHLKDGERSQLMLIVIDDREGDTIRSVAERIQALHFPLDMSAKYALCDTGASITNFIFEKFTKRRNN